MSNEPVLTIDDSDPSLVYSGDWTVQNDPYEPQSTLHVAHSHDSSVSFVFNGTFISAFGALNTDAPSATYSLDGGSPLPIKPSPDASSMSDTNLLFSSSTLNDGQHRLIIHTTADGDVLCLNFLQIKGDPNDVHSDTLASGSSANTHQAMPPVIAAVIVLSCITVVLAIVVCVLILRRRRRSLQQPEPSKGFDILPSEPPTERSMMIFEVLRFKVLGRRRGQPRSRQAHSNTTRSSTLFTSVILPPSGYSSSA